MGKNHFWVCDMRSLNSKQRWGRCCFLHIFCKWQAALWFPRSWVFSVENAMEVPGPLDILWPRPELLPTFKIVLHCCWDVLSSSPRERCLEWKGRTPSQDVLVVLSIFRTMFLGVGGMEVRKGMERLSVHCSCISGQETVSASLSQESCSKWNVWNPSFVNTLA